jgi:hypothetical protein
MFEGKAIICFYSNGLVQGHCIDSINSSSPYSLAGTLLPDYTDPNHNDCMEPDNFYKILIHHHEQNIKDVQLLVRRPRNDDAGGLSSHEHEEDVNEGYSLSFETEKFYAGDQANRLKQKYFTNQSSMQDNDLVVCVGEIKFVQS